ncbi:MAG: glutamate carboxypeptidase [Halioglobus sp.]|jgi:glutamate carboxypeptidase
MNKVMSGLVIFFMVCLLSPCSAVHAADIVAAQVELSPGEKKMLDWIDTRSDQILAELTHHVAINTDTANIKGIDRYRAILAEDLQHLGFATREVASKSRPVLSCDGGDAVAADHLVATRTGSKSNRILLNGHMDTVFPASDEFQALSIEPDGTIHGPGVLDMKGGIVVMLNALRALDAGSYLDQSNITVLFNSDEETGSLGSRELVEKLARQHDVGLVFEGSRENRMTRSRKGLGQVRLKVTGSESHAGAAHEHGVSANLGLAHELIAIEQLTDYQRGVTVNVGVMQGGEKRNTIPGCADASIDLRYKTVKDGEYLLASIDKIASTPYIVNPRYPGLPKTEVWGLLHRPTKQANSDVDALIAEAMGLSQIIGEPIEGSIYSGGGTDGSIAQAVGLPTLDSLGLNGEGAHSEREQTSLASLIARTKLAAVLIRRQIERQRARGEPGSEF